jgi:YesN/AraC family two-component response regulator
MADIDKILIVDDEETLTWSMSKSLSKDKDKFEVLVANSGEDALKVLEKEKIRLVITDIKMPGISGLDLLSRVPPMYRRTPIYGVRSTTSKNPLRSRRSGR